MLQAEIKESSMYQAMQGGNAVIERGVLNKNAAKICSLWYKIQLSSQLRGPKPSMHHSLIFLLLGCVDYFKGHGFLHRLGTGGALRRLHLHERGQTRKQNIQLIFYKHQPQHLESMYQRLLLTA